MNDLSQFLSRPALLLNGIDKERSERSLYGFIKSGWHILHPKRAFVEGWVIQAIAEHLEAVTDGQITRLLVNVPPGSLKSLSTATFWPAWEWGPCNMPDMQFLTTSYKEDYAKRDARRMRDVIIDPWYTQKWGDRFSLTRIGESSFANDHTGWREAMPFASLTSGRADRVLIDDPHSTEGALSDNERQKAVRIFLESVPTRVNDPDKSAIIVIMQRLHDSDVSGTALSYDLGYEHLMIPMEFDPGRKCYTSIGWEDPRTEENELMFPERFPRHVVDRDKIPLGKWGVAGQFQQAPVPRGGGIIKREDWQLWGDYEDPENQRYRSYPQFEFILASIDTAYTEKEENDGSALTIWGIFRDNGPSAQATPDGRVSVAEWGVPKAFLMWATTERMALNDLVQVTAKWCRKFKVDRLLIEAKANGISVAQEMERLYADERWSVEMVEPKGDKVARVYSVEPIFSAGLVYAPYEVYDVSTGAWNTRRWCDEVITQAEVFPKGAHDDSVDSMSMALSWLKRAGMLKLGSELSEDIGIDSYNRGGRQKPLYPS